jgi:hypothetical protein
LGHDFAYRPVYAIRHILRQERQPGSGCKHDLTPVGLNLSADHPHERGLARSVAAQEADPLAGFDLARNPVEQGGPAKANPQVLHSDEGHENGRIVEAGKAEAGHDRPFDYG